MSDFEIIKSNSIGKEKKEKIKKEMIVFSKKVGVGLMAALLTFSLSACDVDEMKLKDYEEILDSFSQQMSYNHKYVSMYTIQFRIDLEYLFKENNLSFTEVNSVEQYRDVIQYLNQDDMLLYYDVLGVEECEKICIAYGYMGLDDFLSANGYVDENNNPSLETLKNSTYERITEEMSVRRR